uniref:GDNF/GAS1 domain-containing protein n=1 Tax=Scleropages formosus TaxID=113540 RepID=A0A8C9R2C5_SCLFO
PINQSEEPTSARGLVWVGCGGAALCFSLFKCISRSPRCAHTPCQQEKDCELAYEQYLAACDGIIRGVRRQCPSHCIGALVKLNETSNGPHLETCDCGQDARCRRVKRAIEPCLPKRHPGDASGIGCTEARQRCEEEPSCRSKLISYLSDCGQLFNGRRCSARCRSTIQQMLFIPRGALLNRCVCDGVERPFCEVVKENMGKLCSVGDYGALSPYGDVYDAYEDEDHETKSDRDDSGVSFSDSSRVSSHLSFLPVVTLMVCWTQPF